jgi:hypothetical protein
VLATSSPRIGLRGTIVLFAAVAIAVSGVRVVSAAGLAEPGDGGSKEREREREAGASPKNPPDPPAIVERMQWVFDLRWERGEVYLLEVRKVDIGSDRSTPRVMGRFALELFEGPTLIERARFDFPMLGAPEPEDGGYKAPPRFSPGLKTRIGVVFPATRRGTRLELLDRATNRRWPLPWPPQEGTYSADGGTK